MYPLKTAQFAELRLIGESVSEDDYTYTGGLPTGAGVPFNDVRTETVGLATNLRINEGLGSTQKNILGTPIPIFVPGFYQGTITMDKATLDLRSWKTMVNMNPYTAYVPSTYNARTGINPLDLSQTEFAQHLIETSGGLPRFLFGVYVYDSIARSASEPMGMYVCMLQSYSTSLSSNDAVIMEDVQLLARPVYGSWLSVLATTYSLSTYLGYAPRLDPQQPVGDGGSIQVRDI